MAKQSRETEPKAARKRGAAAPKAPAATSARKAAPAAKRKAPAKAAKPAATKKPLARAAVPRIIPPPAGLPGTIRIIETEADIAEGVAHLAANPAFAAVLEAAGAIPLRRREPGFEGLCSIIVSQQLSVASANAIWGRMTTHFAPLTPQAILAATDAALALAGLSRPKQRTLRAISQAAADGLLPIDTLTATPADRAHAMLTTVKGIGPWTADIFLMFCLGHADAFAAGDLALQEAARIAFALPKRPAEAELVAMAEAWRPWRGVAARALWAYYRVVKSREGVTG